MLRNPAACKVRNLTTRMNIFIDSNILFKDYFFENKSNKKLLEYCAEGLVNLYMSEIVRLELRRQFQKELENKKRELEKLIKDLDRLKIKHNISILSPDDNLKKFDSFYSGLRGDDNFHILEFKNDFLPYIVDRAINRRKPFAEEKSELKDAIIWKTYSSFVECNNVQNCILLTNNTSDFCEKDDKSKVHHDLTDDTNRFSVINSSNDFITTYASKLESPDYKFSAYIRHVGIDDDFALDIIVDRFEKDVEDAMHTMIDNMHPTDILQTDYYWDGQLVSYGCEILGCENVEYEILDGVALIYGVVYACCETEVLAYNSARDPGEDQYTSVDELNVTFKVYFNFDMQMDKVYSDFEVTDIELSEVN